MKRAVLAAIALSVVVCATAVWSQGPHRPSGHEPGGPGGRPGFVIMSPATAVMVPPPDVFNHLTGALRLSPAQIAKLKVAAAQGRKTIGPLTRKCSEASQALRKAVFAPNYSAKSLKDLAAKAQKAEAKTVDANIQTWTRIRSILTASQVSALRQMMSHGPDGPNGPGGPGPRR